MPDTKISALTAASALTGAEIVPLVQSTETRRTTVGALGAALGTISKYRNNKKTLSGAATLNTATADAGDTLVYTGAAVTWTLPARLASGDTGVTEAMVVHNRGSGAIALSASGVTIKGSTSIPANASCTLEWETASGPTHYVWARSSA